MIDYGKILDGHVQQRDFSCFQMAPELALKLAGLVPPDEYPFQSHAAWDRKGFEPYRTPLDVNGHRIEFEEITYNSPYIGMNEKLNAELALGRFPVVSLRAGVGQPWHGFVVYGRNVNGELLVMTKVGSEESGGCQSASARLSDLLTTKEKVDCLFCRLADPSATP